MTLRYFDSSALVKRYVREPGSERVRAWLRAAPAATSRIAFAEVAAAAARRSRQGAGFSGPSGTSGRAATR